ncbi:hypothetical protein [Trichlorobacter thiogenes]|nr:hypothetical protein [Trichlorobacter thiogenes]
MDNQERLLAFLATGIYSSPVDTAAVWLQPTGHATFRIISVGLRRKPGSG